MTWVPNEEIIDSTLRMRTSLARIELAASRLARDAMTPAARESATGISEAVREIDDEIGEAIRTFRPQNEANVDHADLGDCGPVLRVLRDRIAPILESYEIRWPALEADGEIFLGDRTEVELAALVMLRSGIALAGFAGTIRLALVRDPDTPCIGLCLKTERESAADRNTDTHSALDPLAPIRKLSHRCRGSLEVCQTQGAPIVTLWLAATEAEA